MKSIRNNIPEQLLASVAKRLPDSTQPWADAMLAELTLVEGFWARLQWATGGAVALVSTQLQARSRRNGWRLDLFLIAAYHFVFSAVLIGTLTWQLPRITEPWKSGRSHGRSLPQPLLSTSDHLIRRKDEKNRSASAGMGLSRGASAAN